MQVTWVAEDKPWYPKTFILPEDRPSFLREVRVQQKSLWIGKPRNDYGGAGICVWKAGAFGTSSRGWMVSDHRRIQLDDLGIKWLFVLRLGPGFALSAWELVGLVKLKSPLYRKVAPTQPASHRKKGLSTCGLVIHEFWTTLSRPSTDSRGRLEKKLLLNRVACCHVSPARLRG